jgi:hypothetical protein
VRPPRVRPPRSRATPPPVRQRRAMCAPWPPERAVRTSAVGAVPPLLHLCAAPSRRRLPGVHSRGGIYAGGPPQAVPGGGPMMQPSLLSLFLASPLPRTPAVSVSVSFYGTDHSISLFVPFAIYIYNKNNILHGGTLSTRPLSHPAPDDSSTVRQLRTRRGKCVKGLEVRGGGRAGPYGGREGSAGNSAGRSQGPAARVCAAAWSPAEGWMFVEWRSAGDPR